MYSCEIPSQANKSKAFEIHTFHNSKILHKNSHPYTFKNRWFQSSNYLQYFMFTDLSSGNSLGLTYKFIINAHKRCSSNIIAQVTERTYVLQYLWHTLNVMLVHSNYYYCNGGSMEHSLAHSHQTVGLYC
jgi:hypothetical protein